MDEQKFNKLKADFLALPVVRKTNRIESTTYFYLTSTSNNEEFIAKLFGHFKDLSTLILGVRGNAPFSIRKLRFVTRPPGKCKDCDSAAPDEPRFEGVESDPNWIAAARDGPYCAHCTLYMLAISPIPENSRMDIRDTLAKSIREIASIHGDSCILCLTLLENW